MRERKLRITENGVEYYCPSCESYIEEEGFHVDNCKKHGVATYCKGCHSDRRRK